MISSAAAVPAKRDVVVVGGGIVGLASAFEIAASGASVLLIERDVLGAGQSGRNLGFVRQQGRAPAELPIMAAANRRWRSLSQELGADVEWVMGGNLRLTNDPELAARYAEWVETASSAGLDSRVVTDREIRSILGIAAGKWALGIFTASDGHADPVSACAAYAQAARARGVEIVQGVAVTGLLSTGGRITGVTTGVGEVDARAVVLAAGAGSARVLRGAAVQMPVSLVRQTVVLTTPVPPVTAAAAWTGELFVRQDVRGQLRLAGATRNEIVLDSGALREGWRFLRSYLANRTELKLPVDAAGLARAVARSFQVRGGDEPTPQPKADDVAYCLGTARRMFPQLGEIGLERAWAGEIDATPDALPVIDAPGEHPGLVVAAGMSGHGFGTAPTVGRIVARLVDGADPGFDLKQFRLARFSDGSRLEVAHLL